MNSDGGLLTRNVVVAMLCSIACVACSSNSQVKVANEAKQLLGPGMSIDAAADGLKRHEFDCDYRSMPGAVTCTRARNYAVAATCLQRVNLFPSPDGGTLLRVEVPKPACTGL